MTIPGIKYVVDCGLQKIRTYKNSTGLDALKVLPISKNSATQRAGRAGREQAGGKCFRIYTEESLEELEDNTKPEILRCNLSGIILNLKAMGINDVSRMDFIDKPDQQSFLSAFQNLIKLGAIDPVSANLTKSGREMSVLPTEPIYSKLLITALKPEYKQVRQNVTAIVAMLQVENVFFSPASESEAKILKKRAKLMASSSDHLTLLKILTTFKLTLKNQGKAASLQFCREFFLNHKSLIKATQIQDQLTDYMNQIMKDRNSHEHT